MSGGHFNGGEWFMENIADELHTLHSKNEYMFSPAVIEEMKKVESALRRLHLAVHHLDKLISSDYSEESYFKAIGRDFHE